jgi:hypothetical protein
VAPKREAVMAEVRLRTMIPARHQRWPAWELTLGDQVIGWIFEIHIRGTVNPFFRAVEVHRPTGVRIELPRPSVSRIEKSVRANPFAFVTLVVEGYSAV